MMEQKAEKKTMDRTDDGKNIWIKTELMMEKTENWEKIIDIFFLGETDLYLAKETDTTSATTAHGVLVPNKNTRKK